MNTGREQVGGDGIQTDAIIFGGAPGLKTETEEYNGTSWSEQNDLNAGRRYIEGSGDTGQAALAFGGNSSNPGSGYSAANESYDGTSWTEIANLNSGRFGSGSCGSQDHALLISGHESGDTETVKVEEWNGSSWTEVADVSNGSNAITGTGTGLDALRISGNSPATVVEEWTVAQNIKVITD